MLISLCRLRTEAIAVFTRSNECFDHFGVDKVAVELIKLREPEVIAGVVSVWTAVGIAAEVTEELHQDESAVEFIRHES